jgi:hypothetical protein
MQTNLAHLLEAWMVRHELLPRDRARTMAAVIARQCVHCAPDRRRGETIALEDHWIAARLVAVIFCFEYLGHAQQHPDPLAELGRTIAAARAGDAAAPGNPWLLAISDVFLSLRGPERRDIEVLAAAFEDHAEAVREMALVAAAGHGPGRAPASCCDAIDACLRLRPLLAGMEPFLRCWQTVLDCWPGPSFQRAVTALVPEVRRAYPHAGLDRALDLASETSPLVRRTRSPRLSEVDAMSVVAIYLANDLASVERDRRSEGADRELNIVLLLERHFLAPAHGAPRIWDDGPGALPAPQRAAAATVGLYNVLVARFCAVRDILFAHAGSDDTRDYLRLLARAVDGHVQGLTELAAERVSTAPARESGPAGQASEPRYGSLATLQRLRYIDDAP